MDEETAPEAVAPSLRFIGTDDYLAFYLEFSENKDLSKIKRSDMMVAMTTSPALADSWAGLDANTAAETKAWLLGNGEARYDKIHTRVVNKHNSVKSALIGMGYTSDDVSAANFPLPRKGVRRTGDPKKVRGLFDKIKARNK